MKERKKIPEKELNEMEITDLTNAEFKTLVIRMLKEFIESGMKKTQGDMKFTLSEIKKNLQGTTSKRRRPGFESMIWNIRKK